MPGKHLKLAVSVGLAALLCTPSLLLAQTAPSLGTAAGFAVLASSTVTNTGSTVITGNVGVSPGSAITGFPPGTITGTFHRGDATALQAQNDVTTAFNTLSQPCTENLTGLDLGGLTRGRGVYCFDTSAQLTGTLTLDAAGDPNAVFIIRTGSTLTTAANANVMVINGGQNCNVFWQIGSSATLGTATNFVGNILAQVSITLTTGARVAGRTLARTGAVTLDTNRVDRSLCAGQPAPPPPGCPALTLAPTSLASGIVGVAVELQLIASGGNAPYTYNVTAGAFPPGVSVSGAGVLAGTPTAAGTFTFTIRATDVNGCLVERSYTAVIAAAPPPPCPPITLSPATLPNTTVGVFSTLTITGSGGTAPYVFGVTAGTLPLGVTLTPAGVLAGTPTSAGASTFTIRGTDANGCFRELTYTVTVAVAVPTLSQWALIILATLLGLAGFLTIRRREGANAIL